MNTPYRFTSDNEPTEKQLAELMHEVALEAAQRAMVTNKKLLAEIRQAIATAMQKRLEENKP